MQEIDYFCPHCGNKMTFVTDNYVYNNDRLVSYRGQYVCYGITEYCATFTIYLGTITPLTSVKN
jgi:hypothetical protein